VVAERQIEADQFVHAVSVLGFPVGRGGNGTLEA
jgi:hypothetical protein